MSRRACLLSCLILMMANELALAGPLEPPSGPVSPTGRIPITALPITISTPGTYYLVGDLTVSAGSEPAILISVNDVTIDLRGHTLQGATGRTAIQALVSNITIRNGRINFFDNGVVLGTHGTIDSLSFYSIGGDSGRCVTADAFALVERSSFGLANQHVLLGDSSTVRGCFTSGSAGTSIRVGAFSQVIDCSASIGGFSGVCIETGRGSLVQDCSARMNAGGNIVGIRVGDESRVLRCAATPLVIQGGRAGIIAGSGCLIEDCIVRAVAADGPAGISTAGNCIVRGCIVSTSAGGGIVVGAGSRIENCTVSSFETLPEFPAIQVAGDTVVTGCSVQSGTVGIGASGARNTIDSNSVASPGTAVQVSGAGTVVTRNRLYGAAIPIDLAPGNAAAQVVSVSGFFTGADALSNLSY